MSSQGVEKQKVMSPDGFLLTRPDKTLKKIKSNSFKLQIKFFVRNCNFTEGQIFWKLVLEAL